jgi:hypothetical protein
LHPCSGTPRVRLVYRCFPAASDPTGLRPDSVALVTDPSLLVAAIKRDGFGIVHVAPVPDALIPSYAYTAGLTLAGLPELLIMALSPSAATPILDAAARRCLSAHSSLDGLSVLGLAPTPLQLRPVADDEHRVFAPVPNAMFPGRARMLQLLWPSPGGIYPSRVDAQDPFSTMQSSTFLAARYLAASRATCGARAH